MSMNKGAHSPKCTRVSPHPMHAQSTHEYIIYNFAFRIDRAI